MAKARRLLLATGSARRRDLLAMLAVMVPLPRLAAAAQQSDRVRRVGWLVPLPEDDPITRESVEAFASGLKDLGWVAGKNIRIDYCFAAGDPALYKACAAQLVRASPDILLAGASPAVAPLQEQTRSIPIVFVHVADPVALGFVRSLARPGRNLTGFATFDPPIMGKWLQLLKEVSPNITHVAVIFNPQTAPFAPLFNDAIAAAAPSFGMTVTLAPVREEGEIWKAAAVEARKPGGGLITLPESFAVTHRRAIIAAANRYRLPLMGAGDSAPRDGGLMSYWFDAIAMHGQAASYIDRILRGASPADLPIQRPTKYSLIINLKTAKALGLTVPQSTLARADEVVE
jgi:putative ABC transport system substrate-binding protein